MNKKIKSKQKSKQKQTSGSGGMREHTTKTANDNLLVIDEYPPKPIPINSVKPTRNTGEVPESRRDTPRGSAARGVGQERTSPRRPLSEPPKSGAQAPKKPEIPRAASSLNTKKNQNTMQRLLSNVITAAPKIFGAIIVFFGAIFGSLLIFLRRERSGRSGRAKRTFALAGIGAVALIIVVTAAFFMLRNNAFSINVDGEQVAIVSMASVRSGGEDISDELVRQAMLRIESRVGSRILINENIEFDPMRAARRYFLSNDEAIIRLDEALTFRVEAAAITVEGVRMSIVRSYDEAERILSTIKEPHLGFDIEFAETGFVERVSIDMIYVDAEDLQTSAAAMQALTSTVTSAQEYTVVPGDSLEWIATRNGMTLAQLLEMNPAINPQAPLAIGTVLRLSIDQPLLSVRTAEQLSSTEAVDPPVEYIHTPTLGTSQRRAVQPGTHGEATVIEHVIRVNGIIVDRIEVERIITRPPTPEIIEVGTG